MQLDELASTKKIHWHWVRGHNGHEMNERVDTLARTFAESLKK
jgi:ribonuclease HI